MKNLFKSVVAAASAMLAGLVYAGTITINVPANEMTADALYLVWGDADKGGNLADWGENKVLVAENIPAEGGTYEVNDEQIPENVFLRALAVREIGFVESVEMNGAGQYLDTGVEAAWVYGFEISCQTIGKKSGDWASLFSSRCDKMTVGTCYGNNNTFYVRYRTGEISFDHLKFIPDQRNDLKIFAPNAYLNGELINEQLKDFGWVRDNGNRPIIEPDADGNGPYDHYMLGTCSELSRWVSAKWYGAKLYNMNEAILREFVPAVLDNTAGFYETVTQKFMPNSGTSGEFTANGEILSTAEVGIRPALVSRTIPETATEVYSLTFKAGTYVDTQFKPNNHTRLAFGVTAPEGVTSNRAYFTGALNYDYGAWWVDIGLVVANDGGEMYHVWARGGNDGYAKTPLILDGRHEIEEANGVMTVDGVTWSERKERSFQVGQSIHISGYNRGGGNNPNGSSPMTFHRYRIYDDGLLAHDFVPVRRADGSGTFFDRATGRFVPVLGNNEVTPSAIAAIDGMPLIDVKTQDVTLLASDLSVLEKVGPVAVVGKKTAWFSTEASLGGLVLMGGKLGFKAIDSENLAALTINGKLTFEKTLEIELDPYLKAGEYTVLTAKEIAAAEGAEITLSKNSKFGTGTTTRTLIVEDGVVKVKVEGECEGTPYGWEVLSYIESNGSQYLDTGYIHKANTKVEITANVKAEQATSTGWSAMFGSRNSSGNHNAFIFFAQSDGSRSTSKWNRTGAETPTKEFMRGEKITLVCEGQLATWTNEAGESASVTTTGTADDGVSTMFIFDLNKGTSATAKKPDNSRTTMKLYGMKIYEGEALLHNYVPVRDLSGTIGLYDTKTGAFLTNCGAGSFTTAANGAMKINYIEADAGQFIDTDYIHNETTKIEADFEASENQHSSASQWRALFGAKAWYMSSAAYVLFVQNYRNRTVLNRTGNEAEVDNIPLAKRVRLVAEGQDISWTTVDGTLSGTGHTTGTVDSGASPMYIFDANKATHDFERVNDTSYLDAKLYSFKISDENGVQRDFIPYCDDEGEIGLIDQAHGNKMYASKSSKPFSFGLGYNTIGSALEVYAGTLTAEDLGMAQSVRKARKDAVVVKGLSALPMTTVVAGELSFADGKTGTVEINGAFTALAGTTLVFGFDANGNDAIHAEELDLTDATEENPITFSLVGADGYLLPPGERRLLISADSGAEVEAAMFRATGIPASIEVTEDGIYVVGKNLTGYEWVGGGDGGEWSLRGNWLDGDIPVFKLPALFNVNKNINTVLDLPGVILSELVFGPQAGSFIVGGNQKLTILGKLTNESVREETINVPVEIGQAGETVKIATTGDVALMGDVTLNGSLEKTGAAKLTISGTAMTAPVVDVKEGTLALSPFLARGLSNEEGKGRVNIANGAQFDFGYPAAAGDDSAIRRSYTVRKEFYAQGEGPDGQGAIVNNGTARDKWIRLISNLTLEGATTIGGAARIDFRGEDVRAYLKGEGQKLTVKTTDAMGLVFYNADVKAAQIEVVEGAHLAIEHESALDVPGGIILNNGSLFTAFGATINALNGAVSPIRIADDATVRFYQRVYKTTVNVPFCVGKNATANVDASYEAGYPLTFKGAMTNYGTIVQYGVQGAIVTLDCDYYGTGTFSVPRGAFKLTENFTPVVKIGGREVVENPLPGLQVRASMHEEDGEATILKNVKKMKIMLTSRAMRSIYDLCEAGDLTAEDVAGIEVTAVVAEDAPEGLKAKQGWKLEIRDGRLVARNPAPVGTSIIIR